LEHNVGIFNRQMHTHLLMGILSIHTDSHTSFNLYWIGLWSWVVVVDQ